MNWSFIVLVVLVAYLWYPSNEHNFLVLLDSSTFAVSRLQEIKNLKAAFKVSRNVYDEVKTTPDYIDTKVINTNVRMLKLHSMF